jgi:hypothetical protein
MGAIIMADCLAPQTIDPDEYISFFDAGCDVGCDMLERCKMGKHLADWKAMPTPADLMGKTVVEQAHMSNNAGWESTARAPFFQVCRQGLMLRDIEGNALTMDDKALVLREFADNLTPALKWNEGRNCCLTFRLIERFLVFMEKYPVFVLQWQGDPLHTEKSYRQMIENKTDITTFIESDTLIASFYKGQE